MHFIFLRLVGYWYGSKFPSNIPDCEIVLHSYLADKKQTYFSDDKSNFNRPSNNIFIGLYNCFVRGLCPHKSESLYYYVDTDLLSYKTKYTSKLIKMVVTITGMWSNAQLYTGYCLGSSMKQFLRKRFIHIFHWVLWIE